jgi:hypothetical protein
MASENKKAKTDKKNHPGRAGNWLKASGRGMKGISFYTASDRRRNKGQLNSNLAD